MAGRSEFVEGLVRRLTPLGEVRARAMFGGHGLFVDDLMFALITRAEVLHLKADDENRAAFEAAGMKPHGKMPYHQVPPAVIEESGALLEWAEGAVAAARRAKPAKAKGKSRR